MEDILLSRIVWATVYTISPQSVMTTFLLTLPDLHPNFSIFFTVAKLSPMSASFPKTTCFPGCIYVKFWWQIVGGAYRRGGALAWWWWRTGSNWCLDRCWPWTAGQASRASHQSSRPQTCSRRSNTLQTRPLVQSHHPAKETDLLLQRQIKTMCHCTHLQHEVWNDSMDLWALVAKTWLPSTELFEVVNCPAKHWLLVQQLLFENVFSLHLGVISSNSSISILPTGSLSAEISKNTFVLFVLPARKKVGRFEWRLFDQTKLGPTAGVAHCWENCVNPKY